MVKATPSPPSRQQSSSKSSTSSPPKHTHTILLCPQCHTPAARATARYCDQCTTELPPPFKPQQRYTGLHYDSLAFSYRLWNKLPEVLEYNRESKHSARAMAEFYSDLGDIEKKYAAALQKLASADSSYYKVIEQHESSSMKQAWLALVAEVNHRATLHEQYSTSLLTQYSDEFTAIRKLLSSDKATVQAKTDSANKEYSRAQQAVAKAKQHHEKVQQQQKQGKATAQDVEEAEMQLHQQTAVQFQAENSVNRVVSSALEEIQKLEVDRIAKQKEVMLSVHEAQSQMYKMLMSLDKQTLIALTDVDELNDVEEYVRRTKDTMKCPYLAPPPLPRAESLTPGGVDVRHAHDSPTRESATMATLSRQPSNSVERMSLNDAPQQHQRLSQPAAVTDRRASKNNPFGDEETPKAQAIAASNPFGSDSPQATPRQPSISAAPAAAAAPAPAASPANPFGDDDDEDDIPVATPVQLHQAPATSVEQPSSATHSRNPSNSATATQSTSITHSRDPSIESQASAPSNRLSTDQSAAQTHSNGTATPAAQLPAAQVSPHIATAVQLNSSPDDASMTRTSVPIRESPPAVQRPQAAVNGTAQHQRIPSDPTSPNSSAPVPARPTSSAAALAALRQSAAIKPAPVPVPARSRPAAASANPFGDDDDDLT